MAPYSSPPSAGAPGARGAAPADRVGAGELDEITLRRAQAGAPEACRALVERYGGRVLALATRMLAGDRGGAEDVAQETFLHVFAQLGRFSPLGPARLSTWILTIATRRAIDELRRRSSSQSALTRGADGPYGRDGSDAHGAEPALVAAGPSPEDGVCARELARAAMAAVAQLAPEYRAAFLLREVHDLEYAEIARILEVDVGTVKSRIFRGRAELRRHLEELQRE